MAQAPARIMTGASALELMRVQTVDGKPLGHLFDLRCHPRPGENGLALPDTGTATRAAAAAAFRRLLKSGRRRPKRGAQGHHPKREDAESLHRYSPSLSDHRIAWRYICCRSGSSQSSASWPSIE